MKRKDSRTDYFYSLNEKTVSKSTRKLNEAEQKTLKKFEREELQILKNHEKLLTSQTKLFDNSIFDKNNKEISNNKQEIEGVKENMNLRIKLLDYQIKGVQWMYRQERSDFKGGILADEMGLGKTLQTIGLMSLDYNSINLVICPVVSMTQWITEIEKYGGLIFKPLLYYGTTNEKRIEDSLNLDLSLDYKDLDLNLDYKGLDYKDLRDKDLRDKGVKRVTVLVTSFGKIESAFRRNSKKGNFLFKTNFTRIIIDEAHILKSAKSSTSRAINTMKSNYKWMLTGTPVQNKLSDLYSLTKFLGTYPHSYYFCKKCDCESKFWLNRIPKEFRPPGVDYSHLRKQFCTCGHFSSQHFSWFNRHIQNQIRNYGHTEEGVKVFDRLENITRNVVLRRTKEGLMEELGLPTKRVRIARLYFSEEEKKFYESLYKETRETFCEITKLTEFDKSGDKNSVMGEGVSGQNIENKGYGEVASNYISIFTLLQRMRMSVNHPILVTKEFSAENVICGFCGEEADDPVYSTCKHAFCREEAKLFLLKETKCPVCKIKLSINLYSEKENKKIFFSINPSKWLSSTKIEFIVEQLTAIRQDSPKVIIFSQFVNFLELLRWRLERGGFRCVKIYESVPMTQRRAAIESFNADPEISVFLISLKAGGLALNLTEASHVFIADLWWNPAVEDQAMDRIHRIGQTRPVKITKVIVEDSIESRVLLLQKKKQALFDSAIDGDTSALGRLSEEDLIFLFS